MADSRGLSAKEFYEAMAGVSKSINDMRLEVKGDIRDLRTQFDNLEAGRLTRAEGNISDLRIELQKAINMFNAGLSSDALNTTKLSSTQAIVIGILGAIGVAILTAVAYRVIVGFK